MLFTFSFNIVQCHFIFNFLLIDFTATQGLFTTVVIVVHFGFAHFIFAIFPPNQIIQHQQVYVLSKFRLALFHLVFGMLFLFITILYSQDYSIPNHSSISFSYFEFSFKNFNTNHIMTYLNFLLYVRVDIFLPCCHSLNFWSQQHLQPTCVHLNLP